MEILDEVESLCPSCLGKLPAKKIVEDGDVYLVKECPEHGTFKTLIWRDAELYLKWGYGEDAPGPKVRAAETVSGCPYDCGLCPSHKAETCMVLMEVTEKCDISCPVCFASSGKDGEDPSLETIRQMYQAILDYSGGPVPVQLSGGEPTLRDDLPLIVALGKEMGFQHIQINTHGLRLARDRRYLESLKNSGVDLIYLQFDGVSDEVYRYLRGANLYQLKVRAIENCAEFEIGIMLVPTLIPGVNDGQIGSIIKFAKKWIPFVKGAHFQPISYFGRYPKQPEDKDRITIPEVLRAMESQTEGEIKRENFTPRRRSDSHCGFSGFFVLMEDGRLFATTNFVDRREAPITGPGCVKETPAEHVRKFITQKARFIKEEGCSDEFCRAVWGGLGNFLRRAKTHYLSITCMPFQDVWTVELGRLQGCCIHVVTPYRRLIPFCAYYLTSIKGERLIAKAVRKA